MVYPGRPSRGCGICRKRRVKCDEGKPNCMNCNKRGLWCSGYREWSELHIRNQTLATACRYTPGNNSSVSTDSTSNFVSQSLNCITPTIEDLALQNFFTNFVRPCDPPSVHKGYFQVLPDLYSSSPPSSALQSATSAFALATFRVHSAGRQCISEARSAYALTLSRIQQELHPERGLTKNETLLAVLMMQVIEALLESGSIEAKPESHLNGAMTLIKLREVGGLQDETSQILLSSARAQGIMRSFGRSLGLETPFSDSQREILYDSDSLPNIAMSDRPFRTSGLLHQISQVAELLQVSNTVCTSNFGENVMYNTLDLIERCKSCDAHLVQWAEGAHASWRRISVSDVTSEMISFNPFLGRVDTYSDVFIARSWNYYRIARIFIQIIILRHSICSDTQEGPALLKNLARDSGPESSKFQLILTDMANDICASMPFHLGRCAGHEWSATGIGAYFLIWPLLLAQEALPDNSLQKIWIINQLSEIRRSLSMGQLRIMC